MGGIKKKFQIKALKVAAIKTGIMSNNTARIDTANNKTSAVT